MIADSEGTRACDILVAGGGPAGYAAAIALAKHGYSSICVLERSPDAEYYEPTKALVMGLMRHGKDALRELGVDGIDHAGLLMNGSGAVWLKTDGSKLETTIIKPDKNAEPKDQMTLLNRHVLSAYLYEHILKHHADTIQVLFARKVTSVAVPHSGGGYFDICTVRTDTADGVAATERIHCQLLIGADGAKSTVRKALQAADPTAGWDMNIAACRSALMAGFDWKALILPPCPKFTSDFEYDGSKWFRLCGKPCEGNRSANMYIAPTGPTKRHRNGFLAAKPDHPLWQIGSADAFYAYLEQTFPQVEDWRSLVTTEIAEDFVRTPPGRFPQPQYCGRFVQLFPQAGTPPGTSSLPGLQGCAAMILGDAAHSFPPDLGQGANAAFMDVLSFSRSLASFKGDVAGALVDFERKRQPENKALMQLQQMGSYGAAQNPDAGGRLGRLCWTAGYFGRVTLARYVPALFSPPASRLASQPDQRARTVGAETFFQDAVATARRSDRNIVLLAAALVALLSQVAMLW